MIIKNKKRVTFDSDPKLIKRVQKEADKNKRSLSAQIRFMLESIINRKKEN